MIKYRQIQGDVCYFWGNFSGSFILPHFGFLRSDLYLGKHDLIGTEIYENDVVMCYTIVRVKGFSTTKKFKGRIVYDDNTMTWRVVGTIGLRKVALSVATCWDYNVIGIEDNPISINFKDYQVF